MLIDDPGMTSDKRKIAGWYAEIANFHKILPSRIHDQDITAGLTDLGELDHIVIQQGEE